MKYISHEVKKKFSRVNIKILNLKLKQLRPIAKSRYIDAYNNLSKNQLISLINNLSPSQRPVFKIKQYISQLSKRESKDFIYFNYDYISSKSKDEVDRVLKNTQ